MPKKTVYFYSVHIYSEATKNEMDYHLIKEKFKEVFKRNCKNSALILSDGENQVTMDVLDDTEEYLFAKIGKIKENSAIQFREFDTLKSSEVISNEESREKGLEIFTYFLFDYNYGILSIVPGQAAPNEQALKNILERYNGVVFNQIVEIASIDAVKALFAPGSLLHHLTYTVAVPSSEVLGEEFLGLNKQQIEVLKETSTKKISVSIKNDERRYLANAPETIKNLIESFASKKNEYEDIKFNGRTRNGSTQDYSFENRIYSDKIDIVTHRIVEGLRVKYDSKDQSDEFFVKIRAAYTQHKSNLLALCGRYE